MRVSKFDSPGEVRRFSNGDHVVFSYSPSTNAKRPRLSAPLDKGSQTQTFNMLVLIGQCLPCSFPHELAAASDSSLSTVRIKVGHKTQSSKHDRNFHMPFQPESRVQSPESRHLLSLSLSRRQQPTNLCLQLVSRQKKERHEPLHRPD